jgi:hypothetical protein
MLERCNPLLRLLCLALAGLALYQLSRLAFQRDPLARSRFEAPVARAAAPSTNAPAAATNSAPMRGKPSLPPEVQALVDKIKESQLLGPEIKPPPMALLGIAGPDVFLRGPNGETGVIRVGEELGGVKLLRIGANRVLVEHEKQQKELTIFSGFGSETLLQKKEQSESPPP